LLAVNFMQVACWFDRSGLATCSNRAHGNSLAVMDESPDGSNGRHAYSLVPRMLYAKNPASRWCCWWWTR
jgi:hypothetical protein